ncbi:aminopeptidase [Erysipelotrichaceae bacterium]|nr:aminopeptidase [Erysipelotrichaceae bacterium]
MFEKNLEQYIELIVKRGLNIEKGDRVHIYADVSIHEYVKPVVARIYAAGAVEVEVIYSDEVITRQKYLHDEEALFDTISEVEQARYKKWEKSCSKRLSMVSPNPKAMDGVSSERIMKNARMAYLSMKDYKAKMMGDKMSWSIAAFPTKEWAKVVFPEVDDANKAVDLLWDAIFSGTHVLDGPDACANWDKHVQTLYARLDILNAFDLTSLHYTNSLGTDLVVGLPAGHRWKGGGSTNIITDKSFAPNIPTEEVYTLGDANSVDGIVYSSKPLLFSGQIIDGFKLELKNGVVVDATAEKGDAMLKELLSTDDGAKRFGEVALVPYASPISLSGILFSMTLFDENASCHFALGNAYENTLPASAGKSGEELKELGFNVSQIHVDFMIGTPDLQIMGKRKNGEIIAIFKEGNFAF